MHDGIAQLHIRNGNVIFSGQFGEQLLVDHGIQNLLFEMHPPDFFGGKIGTLLAEGFQTFFVFLQKILDGDGTLIDCRQYIG